MSPGYSTLVPTLVSIYRSTKKENTKINDGRYAYNEKNKPKADSLTVVLSKQKIEYSHTTIIFLHMLTYIPFVIHIRNELFFVVYYI